MPNNYYERLSEMNPGELADGLAMEQEFNAISRGFSKLPTPHRDGHGFEGPTRVGDPVEETDAVNLKALEKLNLPIYRKKITTEDWNTITDAGIYDVVNASGANKAPGHPYGILSVYKFNGVVTQDYKPDQNQQGILLKRVCTDILSSQWGAWDGALPISQVSAYAKTLLDDQDAQSARSTLLLGDAAIKNVGELDGQVMPVGAFGLGAVTRQKSLSLAQLSHTGFHHTDANTLGLPGGTISYHVIYSMLTESVAMRLMCPFNSHGIQFQLYNGGWGPGYSFLHTGNSVKDANGFLKGASPVMRLYGNNDDDSLAYFYRDEGWNKSGCSVVNSEAIGAISVRVDIGHYKVTGCLGFAREGWYIETPADANGNKLLFVRHLQHEDGSIEIWTSTPDYSSGRCAEGQPTDIPHGRWIDLRLCMDDRDTGPNFS